MAVKVNANGTAKTMIDGKVNVMGVTRQISQIWQNVKGVSKLVWENWKSMTGTIFKYNGTLTTTDTEDKHDTVVTTSILTFEKVTRNLKGTMNITGYGGAEWAQYGYTVTFYTNEALTESVITDNAYFTGLVTNRAVSFESPKDVPVYGLTYNVWTWNGGDGKGTSTCQCTGARVTEWEQKGS